MPLKLFDRNERMEKAEREMYGDEKYEQMQKEVDQYIIYKPVSLTGEGLVCFFLFFVGIASIGIIVDWFTGKKEEMSIKSLYFAMYLSEAYIVYCYLPLYVAVFLAAEGTFFKFGVFCVCLPCMLSIIYIPSFILGLYKKLGI